MTVLQLFHDGKIFFRQINKKNSSSIITKSNATTTPSKREKIELTKKRLFFDIEVYFFFPEQEGVIDGFANRKKRLQQYIVVPREKKSESISVKLFFYFWKSARTLSLKKTK